MELCQLLVSGHAQFLHRDLTAQVLVQRRPEACGAANVASSLAPQAKLRKVDRAALVGVKGSCPRVLDVAKARLEVLLEVHQRNQHALCELVLDHRVGVSERLRRYLEHDAIQADDVPVPLAVPPDDIAGVADTTVGPHRQQVEAAVLPGNDEGRLRLRLAALGQQSQMFPALRHEPPLCQSALKADEAGAPHVADVAAQVIDQGDAVADAEADGAQVDGAAGLQGALASRTRLNGEKAGGQRDK
mmetsp:Transcript_55620/g.143275  ORF Transcript_55620/g.143275 Transcript_55620/m.143275 type:complete len:245 (+) Transcript_55620:444-1178(+)